MKLKIIHLTIIFFLIIAINSCNILPSKKSGSTNYVLKFSDSTITKSDIDKTIAILKNRIIQIDLKSEIKYDENNGTISIKIAGTEDTLIMKDFLLRRGKFIISEVITLNNAIGLIDKVNRICAANIKSFPNEESTSLDTFALENPLLRILTPNIITQDANIEAVIGFAKLGDVELSWIPLLASCLRGSKLCGE